MIQAYLEELDKSANAIKSLEALHIAAWREAQERWMDFNEGPGGQGELWQKRLASQECEMQALAALHHAQNRAEDLRVMIRALAKRRER